MGILEIIGLVSELAPKVIAAGGAISELWRAAGGIIGDAEKNGGKVDPDGATRLRALVQVQLDKLHAAAQEAAKP